MREKLKRQMNGRQSDPNEFKPPKSNGEIIKLRFFVLPPYSKGDQLADGPASQDLETFSLPYGQHWVDSRPHTCPRVVSMGDEDCAMCQTGFSIIRELKAAGDTSDEGKAQRAAVNRQWLPQSSYLVNVYFPAVKTNPEDLHNRVMWFKAPKTIWEHWTECLDREDHGDDEDPQAYGAFFDEYAAFLYELRIGKSGDWNEYKTSQFIAAIKGEIALRPIAAKQDGKPDKQGIADILSRRYDLFKKVEPYDQALLERLAAKLVDGDDEDGGFDSDETKGKGGGKKPAGKPATSRRPAPAPVLEEEEEEEEEDELPPPVTRPAKAGAKGGTPKANGAAPKANGKAKAPAPPVAEEDEDEGLSGESPLVEEEDDDTPPVRQAPKTARTAKAGAKATPSRPPSGPDDEEDEGEGDSEDKGVDDMLSQLTESDD